jgi:hypothetical protein
MPLVPSSSLTFLEGNWLDYPLIPDPIMVSWRVGGTDVLVPWVNGPPVPLLDVETRYEPAWMALCRLH